MKLLLLIPAILLLAACATKPEEEIVPVPGGYYQFCEDFPESTLCRQEI